MKKKFYRQYVVTTALAVMLFAAGCGSSGSSSNSAKYESAYDTMGASAVYEEAAMADSSFASNSSGSSVGTVADTSRKLITTMNISAETDDLAAVVSGVESKVKELGGYIESSNISNNASYSSRVSKTAGITARIPKNRLDEFVDLVEGSTNITNKSVNVEDVTLSYVDIESRKNSLRTEEKRLLEILESAETVEDVITVEDKLADVRYELESIESQLRSYDNRIDYSTVYLDISEVVTFTPVEKESATTRMGKGFLPSVGEVIENVVEFDVWFVIHIPQMILIIIAIVLIIIIIRLIDKGSKKRRIKKMQMMQNQAPGNVPSGKIPNGMPASPVQNMPAAPVNNTPAAPAQNAPGTAPQGAPAGSQKDSTDGNK